MIKKFCNFTSQIVMNYREQERVQTHVFTGNDRCNDMNTKSGEK